MRRSSTTAKQQLLRQVPGLEHVGRRELEAMERSLDDVDVRAGTVLVRAGQVTRQAFIVFDDMGIRFVGFDGLRDHKPVRSTVVAHRPARALVVGPSGFASLMRCRSFCDAAFAPPFGFHASTAMAVVPA